MFRFTFKDRVASPTKRFIRTENKIDTDLLDKIQYMIESMDYFKAKLARYSLQFCIECNPNFKEELLKQRDDNLFGSFLTIQSENYVQRFLDETVGVTISDEMYNSIISLFNYDIDLFDILILIEKKDRLNWIIMKIQPFNHLESLSLRELGKTFLLFKERSKLEPSQHLEILNVFANSPEAFILNFLIKPISERMQYLESILKVSTPFCKIRLNIEEEVADFHVTFDLTFKSLKWLIFFDHDIIVESQRLFVDGKEIDDNQTMGKVPRARKPNELQVF